MALVKCVDCGRSLSATATDCGGGCNSTDPFGKKRAEQKAQLVLMLVGLVVFALVFLAFHFDFLTAEMVKNFLFNRPK
ncbi:hypothetical protein [Cellvibrio sp. OA-2007]|uniref:hypothetical protein n=1 Tax=Cellvibrio sp. OA-2007 TaxID=529823 RepID=UPI000A5C6A26|nr:hypothetical protein [Cellvibrio sp. OA-2007]